MMKYIFQFGLVILGSAFVMLMQKELFYLDYPDSSSTYNLLMYSSMVIGGIFVLVGAIKVLNT